VWQTQDLRERVLGSVAMIGVTGDFSEVWQIQDLATFWRKAGLGKGGVRSTARRGRMGLAGQAIDKAVSESQKLLYYIWTVCQAINKSFRCKRMRRGPFRQGRNLRSARRGESSGAHKPCCARSPSGTEQVSRMIIPRRIIIGVVEDRENELD